MGGEIEFEGILPALVTPFTADGSEVEHAAIHTIVDRLLGAGVSGLFPCGSTGEFTSLTGEERRSVVESVIAAAAGRVPVVPHTGAMTTAEAVALSLHAEQAGAVAVMVVPPFYEPLSFRDLTAHFATIAAAVSVPLMYYNLPSATGVTLTFDQLQELERTARVTSLKDTSGNAVTGMELIQRGQEGPTLVNGMDSLTFSSLAAGARAAVWGLANFLPEQAVGLHRALVVDRDLDRARGLWARIYPVCRFLESSSYSAAVKEACNLIGLPAGPTRMPLLPLEDDARAELAELLVAAGAEVVVTAR